MTELFPDQEPLKFKIRERALEVLTDLVLASSNPGVKQLKEVAPVVNKNIDIIAGLFDLAQTQNLADSRNFFVLKSQYDKIKQYLREELIGTRPNLAENRSPLRARRERILEILRGNGGAPVREILPQLCRDKKLSKRTLRRELGKLVKEGIIERMGKCNKIFYRLPILR